MSHPQQVDFCKLVKQILPEFFCDRLVLDIGSLDINGNNQYLFEDCLYLGVDLLPGRNVDLASKGHELALPDGSIDVVISTECFEHDQFYDLTLKNIVRMLKPGGLLVFTCASTGRAEHGTRRTTPGDAPLIQGLGKWADYYKNLEERDIRRALDIEGIFEKFAFSSNSASCDRYFWGIKKGELVNRRDYSFQIRQPGSRPALRASEMRVAKSGPVSHEEAMGVASAALPPRLFTVHGTVLYVDPGSGELRHGPHLTSPANARLSSAGVCATIMHEAAGSPRPIMCRVGGCRTVDGAGIGGGMAEATQFELVAQDQGWVGLKAGEAFLSAIPDGRVALSATACQAWESFLLSDPRPAPSKRDGEPPGKRAPSLSISCIETRDPAKAVRAIESTVACIGVDCLHWFSNGRYPGSLPGVEIAHVTIPDITDFFEDINRVFLRLMPKVVATDFNLIVQPDGFAVNPQAWDDAFWDYDYIGAPWAWMWGGGPYRHGPIVGNGGFSLRSRKLYRALLEIDLKWRAEDWASDPRIARRGYHVTDAHGRKHVPEDLLISLWYRRQLEMEFGIKFCPPELANRFSVETIGPFSQYWLGRSFGFHGTAAAPHYGVDL